MQTNAGTIAIRVGSTAVAGTGTTFTKDAVAGGMLYIPGLQQSFQIAQVLSDTALVLSKAPLGQANMGMYNLIYAFVTQGGFTPIIGLTLPTGNQISVQPRIINRNWKALDREIPT